MAEKSDVVTTRASSRPKPADPRPLPDVLAEAKKADFERQTFPEQRESGKTGSATLPGGTKVHAEQHVIDSVKG